LILYKWLIFTLLCWIFMYLRKWGDAVSNLIFQSTPCVNYFVLNINCRYGIQQNLWNVSKAKNNRFAICSSILEIVLVYQRWLCMSLLRLERVFFFYFQDSKDRVKQLMLHSLKNMQIWVQQFFCDMNSTSLIDNLHVYYNSISFIDILHIWCNFVLGPFEQHESIFSTHYSHDMKICNCFLFMASFKGLCIKVSHGLNRAIQHCVKIAQCCITYKFHSWLIVDN
jgi:hypothetical protein